MYTYLIFCSYNLTSEKKVLYRVIASLSIIQKRYLNDDYELVLIFTMKDDSFIFGQANQFFLCLNYTYVKS